MRTTQRVRFTTNDIYEEIEWATPRGTVTFHTTKLGWYFTVVNINYVYTSITFLNIDNMRMAINRHISGATIN